MNRLSADRRRQIVACLVEGNSIRATCRMTDTAKGTVLKLLVDLGAACEEYHHAHARQLPCRRVQADEIWSFCYAKAKNVPDGLKGTFGVGDVWTWTALDPESKFMVSWLVGRRDADWAAAFMQDVASRLANHVQLTTDGHGVYLNAVENAFGVDIDYAQLVKVYGTAPDAETRYSPAVCLATERNAIIGFPDRAHICTSHVERSNLTMRMGMRRFTRLTNGFSKKVDNLRAAVGLHFMHYNFCRIHQSLRVTPAMELGVAGRAWDLADLIGLLG